MDFIVYALYAGQLTISQQNILATGKSLPICKTAVTLEPVPMANGLRSYF